MKTLLKVSLAMMIVSSALQAAPKWIDPPQENCTSNGGTISNDGVCQATWKNATAICLSLGAKLPTMVRLRKEVENCGGVIGDFDNNKNDPAYQSCYKNKGFSSADYYWSSTRNEGLSGTAWGVAFDEGYDNADFMTFSLYVRCVRAGQ